MVGSIISIIIAALLWKLPLPETADPYTVALLMTALTIPALIVFPFVWLWVWFPMQKAEENTTPHIVQLFHKDKLIIFTKVMMIAFPLITFAFLYEILFQHTIGKTWIVMVWVILWGASTDSMFRFIRRVTGYLDPFVVVGLFTEQAKLAIENNQESDLCSWIDALCDVAIKGIQRHNTSISVQALDEEQEIASYYLNASKSIAHPEQDAKSEALGISDKVNFTMFYIYQRLEMIFDHALDNKLDMLCNSFMADIGKIIINAAKYDITMALPPIHLLNRTARKAQNAGFENVSLTASCTSLEVAKGIVNDIDVRYYKLTETFLVLINGMETLAKTSFQRDKATNLDALVQPFFEMKVLFNDPKVRDHQDTPAIVATLDRIIGEFEALRQVLTTMPPKKDSL